MFIKLITSVYMTQQCLGWYIFSLIGNCLKCIWVYLSFQMLYLKNDTGWGKVGLQLEVYETEFILVLLHINYCIIFHTNNCKPTFAPPCI